MKKLIILAALILAFNANAQEIKREGNTFSKANTTQVDKAKKTQFTPFTWKDSKGIEYPIYIGPTGSTYIIKVSKKTGKEYKQYLGAEVSIPICDALGIEYKPKK